MDTLYYIGLIFVLGALVKWISFKLKVLNVVGYLIMGYVIGPDMLEIVDVEFIEETHIISDLSLALISVLVGANLKYNIIKKMLKKIIIVSFTETLFTFIIVSGGFYIFFNYLGLSFAKEQHLAISLLFGGLAAATAPATILATIHELKAKGNFSSFMLSVVALDNAIALIFFSFIVTLTKTMIDTNGLTVNSGQSIFWIVILSVISGVVGAIISEIIDRIFSNHSSMKTTSTLGMIFIVYSLSEHWGLEPLLSSLVMGVMMANLSKNFFLVKKEFDYHLKDIIFLLFFTLSAMHLNAIFLRTMPLVIVLYVLFRIIGKIIGVRIGATLSNTNSHIKNYLGIALFPQAGIAIGLSFSLQNEPGFELIGPIILNIILATTIIHELIGPIFTRYVLKKSKECRSK